jgi:hypothetical protein
VTTTRRVLEPDHLEKLLGQLSTDREQAGMEYEHLRRRLITMFTIRHCADPASLADETLDRVARKIAESPGWSDGLPVGKVRVFGVAWNVARESFREERAIAMPGTWDPAAASTPRDEADEVERTQRCLDACLTRLTVSDRDLVLSYFREQRRARIEARSTLASTRGLTAAGLRVKVHRLVGNLRSCVETCLGRPPLPAAPSTAR